MSTTQKPCCGKEVCDDWVACDICDKWFHLACVGLKCLPGPQEAWFCQSPACQLDGAQVSRNRKRKRKRGEEKDEGEEEDEDEDEVEDEVEKEADEEDTLDEFPTGDDEREWHPSDEEHVSVGTEEEEEEQVEEQEELVSDREEADGQNTTPVIDTWRRGHDVEIESIV
jgi:hypothetical protein